MELSPLHRAGLLLVEGTDLRGAHDVLDFLDTHPRFDLVVRLNAQSDDQEEGGTEDEEGRDAADYPDPDRRPAAAREAPLARAVVVLLLVLVRVGTAKRPARRIVLLLVPARAFGSAGTSAGLFRVGEEQLAVRHEQDGLAAGQRILRPSAPVGTLS